MRWLSVAVCAVALVLIGLAATTVPALRDRIWPRPNVVLIVLDSLRADRVDLDGVPGGLTPFLAELAARSTVYERAYAPSSWTVPVVASLMTGQYPSEHRMTNFLSSLDKGTPTLAELLARRGYATTAVGANAALREDHGFARGFERYKVVGEPNFLNPKSDGWLVIDQALRWVDEAGRDRPQFLYLHFMDVHMPYRTQEGLSPPAPASIRPDGELVLALVRSEWNFSDEEVQRLEDLYDGEVRYEDALLRYLFGELAARGILDNALVAVLADHGEEFGEHDVFGHGASLHETVLRVPLLVRFPDREAGRVHEPVQVAGLTASILDAAGVSRPDSVHVDPIPRIGAAPPVTVFSELVESGQRDHWLHKQSLVADQAKLLVTPDGTRLAFDLATDPFERSPTPPKDDSLDVALAAQLARLRTGVTTAPVAPDPDTQERLRALGYLNDH
jgi:arylsulfatase A-like enzyme